MKFLEGHLTQEKDDGPKKKETHNRLGLLVQTFQKLEERNDFGRQFMNISLPPDAAASASDPIARSRVVQIRSSNSVGDSVGDCYVPSDTVSLPPRC